MHGLIIHNSKRAQERRSKISSFVAGLCLLALCPPARAQTAQDLANKMNTEQKVGQVMIWSFLGADYSDQLEDILTRYQPGALILFRRNIKTNSQVARLNSELQKAALRKLKAPLLLMIDQEGGVVTRVKVRTPLPSALALGRISDPELIEKFAQIKGEMLLSLGFNVNLAPVMDISNPDKDSFIGNRTFGDDPVAVTELSLAYSRGLNRAGIVPTGKHFPGHGGTITDSHQAVPKKMSTEEELVERDFVPFKAFAAATYPRFIMMAHLALPNVDPLGLPATYSPVMIKEHLRKKLRFGGVIITDDLEMQGAAVSPDIGERAVRAFLAGNDMLMLAGSPSHQRKAFRAMINAVNEGRISRDRLNESVVRILEAKLQLKPSAAKIDERKATWAAQRLETLSRQVMEKNFALAAESHKEWPEIQPKTRTIVFSNTRGFYYYFNRHFNGRSKLFRLTPDTIDDVADALADEKIPFAIFYASGARTARWLATLNPALKAKLIVINCNHGGEVEDQESFLSVLNLNSHSPEAGMWLAKELNKPKPIPEPEPSPELDLRTPAGDSELEGERDRSQNVDGSHEKETGL